MSNVPDDLPIWAHINRDYENIEHITNHDFPDFIHQMLQQSSDFSRLTKSSNSKSLLTSQSVPVSKRIQELNRAMLVLSEFTVKVTNYTHKIQSNLATLLFAEDAGSLDLHDLRQYLRSPLYDLYIQLKSAKTPAAPFQRFTNIQNHWDSLIRVIELFRILISYETEEIAPFLFRMTKSHLVKSIAGGFGGGSVLPLWPYVLNSYASIQNMRIHMQQQGNECFVVEEIEFVSRKIDSILTFIFNHPSLRASTSSADNVETGRIKNNLDIDLKPYIVDPVDALGQGTDFLSFISAQFYALHAFRAVLQFSPSSYSSSSSAKSISGCKIVSVQGDGNCFYRAAVKAVFHLAVSQKREGPLLARIPSARWETHLAKSLRKRLNAGEAQRLKREVALRGAVQRALGESVSYPFEGFVIGGVNDSVTMAREGVWADHVQVKKLARLIDREVWLVCFDDVGLKKSDSGFVRPGKDYIIRPFDQDFGDDEKEEERPVEEWEGREGEEPMVLYYTPTPGHYEVLLEPERPGRAAVSVNGELSAAEAVEEVGKQGLKMLPIDLLGVFWRVEAEVETLVEIIEKRNQGMGRMVGWLPGGSDRELADAVSAEIKDRAIKCKTLLSRFYEHVSSLEGSRYLDLHKTKLPDTSGSSTDEKHKKKDNGGGNWVVVEDVIRGLVVDDAATPLFVDGALEFPGTGPLSDLCVKLYNYQQAVMRPPPLDLALPVPPSSSSHTSHQNNHSEAVNEKLNLLLNMTLSSNRATVEVWNKVLVQTLGVAGGEKNLKFDKVTSVNAQSLKNLLMYVVTGLSKRDSNDHVIVGSIEFMECVMDEKCCEILEQFSGQLEQVEGFAKLVLVRCRLSKEIKQGKALWTVP